MKRLVLFIAMAAICGCTNPMLVDLHRGTFCNSTNVEAYANKHGITYQQALEELRRQSDQMWTEEEAKQAASASSEGPM